LYSNKPTTDLLRAYTALPEERRSMLLLIGIEDLSYEQAARVLRVLIGTVMSRVSRGRERPRHYMNEDVNSDQRRRKAELRRVK
jgi:DNA-directed RNA polymerase specialized sigma24 family protein